MKVALLVPGGVDRTGTHRVIPCILWLIERLVAAGDEVHVFALRQEAAPGEWTLLGARVRNAGLSSLRSFAQLAAEHRRGRFDVVHAFWATPAAALAAAAGRAAGVPLLLYLAGGELVRLPEIGYGARLGARGRAALRVAAGAARAVAAPSGPMLGLARGLGIEATRIPLGVALDRWPPRPPRPREPGAPARLLHVGSLNRVKDQETLLRAAALLRERGVPFRLDVLGEDTLGGAVHRLAEGLGLSGVVRFHGFLPHSGLRPWMEEADLLVVSSRHEAGPLVVLEAAVAGVPTVGTAVGHLADWAGDACLAVPVADPGALAAGVARLLADEPGRLRMAERAQARALAENADHTARAFRALYARLAR
jgi:glycosyltransferase involved in cell wall biosynthesis